MKDAPAPPGPSGTLLLKSRPQLSLTGRHLRLFFRSYHDGRSRSVPLIYLSIIALSLNLLTVFCQSLTTRLRMLPKLLNRALNFSLQTSSFRCVTLLKSSPHFLHPLSLCIRTRLTAAYISYLAAISRMTRRFFAACSKCPPLQRLLTRSLWKEHHSTTPYVSTELRDPTLSLCSRSCFRRECLSKPHTSRKANAIVVRNFGKRAKLLTNEWISILKLSSMWEFEFIRRIAIRELSKSDDLDPGRKYLLATTYHVDQWLIPALSALAARPSPLSSADVDLLGLECVLKLAQTRELALREASNTSMSHQPSACNNYNCPIKQSGIPYRPKPCSWKCHACNGTQNTSIPANNTKNDHPSIEYELGVWVVNLSYARRNSLSVP